MPKSTLLIVFTLTLIAIIFGFLYQQNYISCLTIDLSMCLRSKQYTAPSGEFSFRYPDTYPLSAKNSSELMESYNGNFGTEFWIDFSAKFYPNAGGERLGSIRVKAKNPYKNINELISAEPIYKTSPSIEKIQIGGKDAVCEEFTTQLGSFDPPSYNCSIISKGKLYWLSFDYNDYYHKLPVEYYIQAKNLILSTFKFRD